MQTVLLLEDNQTDVFVIREVLASCGLELRLHVTRDGQEALEYLQDLARDLSLPCPAVVLLDLNVPKVDGIEVLRALRRHSRCSHTPVIVVSSSVAHTDRAAARSLGAEEYFQKPKDLATYMQLGQIVKRVLRSAEDGDQ